MSRWGRPARPRAPIGVSIAIVGTWWLVAHNGGSGWVQVLGDMAFGALFVGVLGPSVVLARARVRVINVPSDSTAGLPVELRVAVSTRLRVRAVDPPGPEELIGPVPGRPGDEDVVVLLPARRGVHDTVTLDIATAAPFALQWWTRRIVLALPAVLHVAPRCGQPVELPMRPDEHAGDSSQVQAAYVGDPRGARPYRSGDDRRRVHWRATAHTGELMVRELEEASAEPVKMVVALPPDPEAAERVAERALATVLVLLDRGGPVLLATNEANAPAVGEVSDRRGAGRRLARAVTSPGAAGIAVSK